MKKFGSEYYKRKIWEGKANPQRDRPHTSFSENSVYNSKKGAEFRKKALEYAKSRAGMSDNEHMLKRRKGLYKNSKGLGNN